MNYQGAAYRSLTDCVSREVQSSGGTSVQAGKHSSSHLQRDLGRDAAADPGSGFLATPLAAVIVPVLLGWYHLLFLASGAFLAVQQRSRGGRCGRLSWNLLGREPGRQSATRPCNTCADLLDS